MVGTFEDLDVSADKYTPWERPDLGKWLTDEKSWEWDILVFSKVDRAFRTTDDCHEFAKWIEANKKILVFAEDGQVLNYRDEAPELERMMSKFFVTIAAFFAQIELNRFKTRAKDAHRVIRQTDRWAAGVAPLGFKTIDHPSGKGKTLDTDPDSKKLLHDMSKKLLDGWSLVRIAQWLNETGAKSNRAKARTANGKPSKIGTGWNTVMVAEALSSTRTQGLKTHHKKALMDADGNYIQIAPPTFDDETWTKIQEALQARKQSPRSRTASENPLLGIGFCTCGTQLSLETQKHTTKDGTERVYRYYRCGKSNGNRCKGVLGKAGPIEASLERTFLRFYGSKLVTRRVFIPGSDNRADLERVKESIQRLRGESDAGLIITDEDKDQYHTRLRGLIAQRTALEASPVTEPRWIEETTGETYSEAWAHRDWLARRDMLKDAGIGFHLPPSKGKGEPVSIEELSQIAESLGVKDGDSSPLVFADEDME